MTMGPWAGQVLAGQMVDDHSGSWLIWRGLHHGNKRCGGVSLDEPNLICF